MSSSDKDVAGEAGEKKEKDSGAATRLAARLAMLEEQADKDLLAEADQGAPVAGEDNSAAAARSQEAEEKNNGGRPGLMVDALKADSENKRGEVSAATIGRMLGLVTQGEFSVLEGKVDLVLTRLSTVLAKLERVATMVNAQPLGSDLERIDAQIAALRSLLKDAMTEQSLRDEDSRKQAERVLRAVKSGGRSEESSQS